MCHFRCPWNGIFDCHRAEITVMQFTGHSLPVHQSMTVPRDFTLSHIVSQSRLRQWNMQLPRLWNGMFGRVEGQYPTISTVVSAGSHIPNSSRILSKPFETVPSTLIITVISILPCSKVILLHCRELSICLSFCFLWFSIFAPSRQVLFVLHFFFTFLEFFKPALPYGFFFPGV